MSLIGALTKAVKAGEAAKKTAPFYSTVDEALANIARPKGTGAEFFTELVKQPGVKKAELADRKLEQAFKAKGKITKEEAQQILKENPPPKLTEKVLDDSQRLDEEEIREIVSQEMFGKPYDEVYNGRQRARISDEVYRRMDAENGTVHGDWKTPGGENYREILLKLPEGFTEKESNRLMELEANLRRGELPTKQMQELVALQTKKQNAPENFEHIHWRGEPNVLAHMRVQDRLVEQPPQKGFYVVNKTSGRQSAMFDTPEELQAYVETLPESIRNNVTMVQGERKVPPKKVLHVEEIQSDWHQKGRTGGYANEAAYQEARQKADEVARAAGFNDAFHAAEGWKGHGMENAKEASDLLDEASKFKSVNAVPDAPFKKNWHELAMKRLLNYAADNGYDSIAITPGAEQAKRFSLSQHVDKIDYFKNPDGTYNIVAYSKQKLPVVHKTDIDFNQLSEHVGKEIAQKIADAAGAPRPTNLGIGKIGNNWEIVDSYGETIQKHKTKRDAEASLQQIQSSGGTLSGIDLEVGGEGMKGFYDKMLTDYLNNFGKPYGAQVGQIGIRDPNAPSSAARYAIVRDADNNYRLQDTHSEQFALPEIYKSSAEAESAIDDKLNRSMKLHNFPITPEMRQQIQQKGLPLYQQIGIPTAGAGAASQMPEPEEGLAGGGVVNSLAKTEALAKLAKLREQMAPRAEAVKNLIAKDANSYLRDVVPNSLTNPEIEAEIARMAAKAPQIIKPSGLTELKKIVEQQKGGYGARRVERAADEIPNLEKLYKQEALKEAFLGDNAKALMTMNPADFEKYAVQLNFKTNRSNYPSLEERIRSGDLDKHDLPTDEYIKFLRTLPHGFEDVPFLQIDKQEYGLPLVPSITGHEGRHRSRALAESGEKSSLVRLLPNPELREPLPRRSQQEYIEALKKELEMTGNKVVPEDYGTTRPPIILPDVYAKGGSVKRQVKKADGGAINYNTAPDMSDGGRIIQGAPFKHGGKVKVTTNRDAMFMELSNKKLKRK